MGQIKAIDKAYSEIKTEYIFHCEDDWEFTSPGFIEKSLSILEHNNEILQVWLRALDDTNRCPVLKYLLFAETVPYRLMSHDNQPDDWDRWGAWHGFSWNPGLRRRREYELLGSFASLDFSGVMQAWEVESAASVFYKERGFYAAILADNAGRGYVRHLGSGRRVAAV